MRSRGSVCVCGLEEFEMAPVRPSLAWLRYGGVHAEFGREAPKGTIGWRGGLRAAPGAGLSRQDGIPEG